HRTVFRGTYLQHKLIVAVTTTYPRVCLSAFGLSSNKFLLPVGISVLIPRSVYIVLECRVFRYTVVCQCSSTQFKIFGCIEHFHKPTYLTYRCNRGQCKNGRLATTFFSGNQYYTVCTTRAIDGCGIGIL